MQKREGKRQGEDCGEGGDERCQVDLETKAKDLRFQFVLPSILKLLSVSAGACICNGISNCNCCCWYLYLYL